MWGHSRIHYNTFKKQVMDDENFQSMSAVVLFGDRTFHPDNQCKGIYSSPRANKSKIAEAAGPSQEAFPRDDNPKKRPKVLDFDLNELPPTNQD